MFPRQIEFKELDEKIATRTLTLKDVTDKALAINIALREKLPNNPAFRNPIIQGYAAWLIMYDYLINNRDQLDENISRFLESDSHKELSITSVLKKVSGLLNNDFNARIRDDVNSLNEAEIITRSKDGVVYNYYSEDQKLNILKHLKNKSFLNDKFEFITKFYLFYRERDGRFFCVADTDIDIIKELNLSLPPVVDILSTHITLNEGQNLKEIFDKYFKDKAVNVPPCKLNSKEPLLYCGVGFENVKLSLDEMYQLELCKNPPITNVNVIEIKRDSELYKFKERYNFPIPNRPVPLHINIGVTPRELSLEISGSEKKSVLDFINPTNPFVESLAKNILEFQSKQQMENYGKLFQPAMIETSQSNPEIKSNAAQQSLTKIQSSFSS